MFRTHSIRKCNTEYRTPNTKHNILNIRNVYNLQCNWVENKLLLPHFLQISVISCASPGFFFCSVCDSLKLNAITKHFSYFSTKISHRQKYSNLYLLLVPTCVCVCEFMLHIAFFHVTFFTFSFYSHFWGCSICHASHTSTDCNWNVNL